MIRTAVLYLWTFSAAVLVGYFLWALIAWWREEMRVILFRRQVRRTDRRELRKRNLMRGAL